MSVGPIEATPAGERPILDAMLREVVAAAGVFVSSHHEVILKMGTKEVLYRTRDMGWGCDRNFYRGREELRRELPCRLAAGEAASVLKLYHGNGGDGAWKVALAKVVSQSSPQPLALIRVRHTKRRSIAEETSLDEILTRCEPYFRGQGGMIDQAYQPRLTEGMILYYPVQNVLVGYEYQTINALYSAPPGGASS